jgi:hypothetical protein
MKRPLSVKSVTSVEYQLESVFAPAQTSTRSPGKLRVLLMLAIPAETLPFILRAELAGGSPKAKSLTITVSEGAEPEN